MVRLTDGLVIASLLCVVLAPVLSAQEGWWMKEPIRWVQTNLRENDAALDPQKFVGEIADFDANALLMALGGISAFYPSRVQYHYVSPYIPQGHDTFGEVLKLCHARGIRVVGRFDFSKAHRDVYEAHQEWFFKKADGQPAPYNGLYQACVNGGWYREKAPEILSEALEHYDVDGLFFNMFSNPAADYSGHPLGICPPCSWRPTLHLDIRPGRIQRRRFPFSTGRRHWLHHLFEGPERTTTVSVAAVSSWSVRV